MGWCEFSDNSRHVSLLGLGPHVLGRLWSGMRVSASFHIIPRPVGQLGLASEPHVVGRLGSGPRVWTNGYLREIFPVGSCLQGGYLKFKVSCRSLMLEY